MLAVMHLKMNTYCPRPHVRFQAFRCSVYLTVHRKDVSLQPILIQLRFKNSGSLTTSLELGLTRLSGYT
jgi:hypothetical protein